MFSFMFIYTSLGKIPIRITFVVIIESDIVLSLESCPDLSSDVYSNLSNFFLVLPSQSKLKWLDRGSFSHK